MLGLEQTTLPLFINSYTLQGSILSLEAFEPTTTWSKCHVFIMFITMSF